MGRGLSDLQKDILTCAYNNYATGDNVFTHKPSHGFNIPPLRVDAFYYEILIRHFGFENRLKDRDWRGRVFTGQHFDKDKIGKERYNAAQAALSRAVTRLHQRGLITFISGALAKWTGVNLTPAGIEVARRLSVKQCDDGESINQ
jgi:hypothetical protein